MPRNRFISLLLCAALAAAGACGGDDEEPTAEAQPSPAEEEVTECPLSGVTIPGKVDIERAAVAVKIENSPAAYPLSGLQDAEIVYEELVEGGITRFLAIYHCTDSKKAGPVRSARIIDPAIMQSITRVLAAAGGNDIVRKALDKAKLVHFDEDTAGKAMRRVERPGISSEHTLYASTDAIRKLARKRFDEPPPEGLFRFGDLTGETREVKSVTIQFGGGALITYKWTGDAWRRSDGGSPLKMEDGPPIEVDNVLIEQHRVVYSDRLFDVVGNPSIEIADPKAGGKAILFRDGQVIEGRWTRRSEKEAVRFLTNSGEEMVFAPGSIWIELLPDPKGEVNGAITIKPSKDKKQK